jgi:hypothetical protein
LRRVVTAPLAVWSVTWSSRGIDIIEIQGLLGSMRTSSISLECGSTGVVVVWLR